MPITNKTAAAAALAAILASGCARHYPPPAPAASTPRRLTIAVSGNLLGRLDPGGCQTDLHGGIKALQAALATLDQPNRTLFYFDTGDLFSPAPASADDLARRNQPLEPWEDEMFQFLYQLRQRPPDAIVPGEIDLRLGCRFLRQTGLPFVISNQLDRSAGPASFANRLSLRKGSWRISVIGWMQHTGDPVAGRPPCLFADPRPEAQILQPVPAGTPPPDLTVLLLHGGRETAERLAALLPAPALILAGHSGELTAEPLILNRSLYLETGNFGQELPVLDLTWPEEPLAGFSADAAAPRPGFATYRFRLLPLPLAGTK